MAAIRQAKFFYLPVSNKFAKFFATFIEEVCKMKYVGLLFFLLIGAAYCLFPATEAQAAAKNENIVLVVPARPRIIELAFDLAHMRDVTVVSFQGKADSADALLHVWNGKTWDYVSFDDFCQMRFINLVPSTTIVIGDDQTVPKGLIKGMAWPGKVERMLTLNIADLVNGLNAYFNFSSREWKKLADRYDLKLVDLNAERRAYNPYDVPRSRLPLPTEFKQEKGDLPPAVIEKSGAAKPAEKKAEKP
jgi:hypothetical protein